MEIDDFDKSILVATHTALNESMKNRVRAINYIAVGFEEDGRQRMFKIHIITEPDMFLKTVYPENKVVIEESGNEAMQRQAGISTTINQLKMLEENNDSDNIRH